MAILPDIQAPRSPQDGRQLMDYLRQLEEQLRYVTMHLGAENIQPGAIGENQLSPQVRKNLQTVEKTVKDMNRSVSSYRQTAEEIAMQVRSIQAEGVEKVKNAALTINAEGIDMAGGEINIRTGSAFRAKSGGVFEVFAADENSFLKFGGTEENPNASLGNGGTLRVKTIYADSIHANSADLMEGGGALSARVVVAAEKPSGHGILWVKPQDAATADYTIAPDQAVSMDGAVPDILLSLSPGPGFAPLAGNACRYGVKFSLYNSSGSCVWTGVRVYVSQPGAAGEPLLIYESSPGVRIGLGDYFQVDTLNAPSQALMNLTAAASLSLRVCITKSASTRASFPAHTPITLRCSADAPATADGAQACEVRYVP